MSKKAEQTRVAHKENAFAVEQTSIYEDNLLPAADELAKLKELDPDVIEWVKKRTEIEQDARLSFNANKIKLMDKNMSHVFTQNMACIIVAFIIILCGMACSFYFVYKGLNMEGTVFGGTSIILAAAIFIRWTKPDRNNTKE